MFQVYLHQHFKPSDPLEWEDEKRGQRKSLADAVLLQTGQSGRKAGFLLPNDTRGAMLKLSVENFSLSLMHNTTRNAMHVRVQRTSKWLRLHLKYIL